MFVIESLASLVIYRIGQGRIKPIDKNLSRKNVVLSLNVMNYGVLTSARSTSILTSHYSNAIFTDTASFVPYSIHIYIFFFFFFFFFALKR